MVPMFPPPLCNPPAVDVTYFLEQGYNRSVGSLHVEFPYINSASYLSMLSTRTSYPRPRSAVVIVAPKSAGKSEGLQKMTGAWTDQHHFVLDLNLKGESRGGIAEAHIFAQVAHEVLDLLESFKHSTYICMSQQLQKKCSHLPARP